MADPVRILSWNLERVPPTRRRGLEEVLEQLDYDIAVLTETRLGFVHDTDVLAAEASSGRFAADERKVVIWSRWGWGRPEPVPDGVLPDRWVAATTPTPSGALRVIGICVPYRFHRVRWQPVGRDRRRVWEAHLRFLEAITEPVRPGDRHQVIAGDFNQRVPPVTRLDPRNGVRAREAAMAGHTVLTEGLVGHDQHLLLCHVAATVPALEPAIVVDRHAGNGHALSDHHGAVVTILGRDRSADPAVRGPG